MDSVCQQKNVNEELVPSLVLKDICKIRVKEGEKLVSEPWPRSQPYACRHNFSRLGIHIFQSVSSSERNSEIQVSNRLLVAWYAGRRK